MHPDSTKYSPIKELASIFSSAFFEDFIRRENRLKFDRLSKILCDDFNVELNSELELVDSIYAQMRKSYRNEYFFKNEIINKILLGIHNTNTATFLNEFRVNNSKADLAILNGKTTAYEIKSEYDNFNRLKTQLSDYSKFFENVYVVIAESHLEKIHEHISDNIGVLVLTKRGTLSKIKEAKSNVESFDNLTILDSLRQLEYVEIYETYFNETVNVSNFEIYSFVQKRFNEIPKADLNNLLIRTLKKRTIPVWKNEFVNSLPHSLKLLGLKNKITKRNVELVQRKLLTSVN